MLLLDELVVDVRVDLRGADVGEYDPPCFSLLWLFVATTFCYFIL